ncbi:CRISPR-associated endoribonuclease Cas6 [Actinoalloteichus caeruleus]|uniref:CRISPR-associated endoribonuclease Cas6 n=1 Tax=Actinoalloteichus cyanogriseus TaxID=2893586 RepID=UPI003AAE1198
MRLRATVTTTAPDIPWAEVLRPGRGIVYQMLGDNAPALGAELHSAGFGPHRLVPVGCGAPRFPRARRQRGRYAAGGEGTLEFGSPLPEVIEALAAGLAGARVLDWGGVALRVQNVVSVPAPEFSDGSARLATTTPVVVKGPPARDAAGARLRSQRWLLPGEPEWDVFFVRNLRRKAETLGLDPEISLTEVWRVGPKRSFAVGQGDTVGAKVGAAVGVTLVGSPDTLAAVWSWGLGAANIAGFGAVET